MDDEESSSDSGGAEEAVRDARLVSLDARSGNDFSSDYVAMEHTVPSKMHRVSLVTRRADISATQGQDDSQSRLATISPRPNRRARTEWLSAHRTSGTTFLPHVFDGEGSDARAAISADIAS